MLTARTVADHVGGRTLPVPRALVRAAAAASYRAHLQPSEPGWLDLALDTPLMDTARAADELGWDPKWSSIDAIGELFDGIGDGAGSDTPPLVPRSDE